MMKTFFSILLLLAWPGLSPAAVTNNNIATTNTSKIPKVEPAIGYGSQYLNMTLETPHDKIEYSTTNQNFWFVNLAMYNFSAQLKIPIHSDDGELQSRGNTTVLDYQISFELTRQWQLEAYYQNYRGYYLSSGPRNLIDPDLQFAHSGGQVVYVFNPEYAAAMIRTTSWKQTSSAGSWMLSGGVDHFDLSGKLDPTELIPSSQPPIQGANAEVLSLRVSYGYNWLWNNWFAGLTGGLGASYAYGKYDRGGDSITREERIDPISNAGVSGGYQWEQSKVGIFSRLHSWRLAFGDEELNSNTSSTGLYFSSVF